MACAITLSTAYTDLAARLYDPTNQFWTQPELLAYLCEALREWNALTGYWRGDFIFPAFHNQPWYDLTQVANTLRPQTVLVDDLYTTIEYHLLEPPVGAGPWTGSAQFAISDIQSALSRRINETLGATGCLIVRQILAGTPGRIALPTTTLDVRRLAFLPTTGFGSPSTLWEDDTWAWQAFEPDYTTKPQGIPETYSLSTQPFLTFDVDRNLSTPGQYELLSVPGVSTPPGTHIVIPDDWGWVAKFGALADLLGRESNAKDVPRQTYCERRFAQGIELLAHAPALLGLRVNNIPVEIDAITSADQYRTDWEAAAPGAPQHALVAGLNLLALAPQPDSAAYSLTATVVENCPVPSVPTDCLNITQDIYEAILDEAQHLAAFKMGGQEFAVTIPLHQRYLATASLYASRIAEMGEFATILFAQSQQEDERNPRFSTDTPTTIEATNG